LRHSVHEALLKKNSTDFWKCWQSKCEFNRKCAEVEGCVDADTIAGEFAHRFHSRIRAISM